MQPALVHDIAAHLPKGGWLWMQSDVHDVAVDMRETVRAAEPVRLRDAVAECANAAPDRGARMRSRPLPWLVLPSWAQHIARTGKLPDNEREHVWAPTPALWPQPAGGRPPSPKRARLAHTT